MNTSSIIHKGINLLFADIPENLSVLNISTDVPDWNKLQESYYECLFAFVKSNLYDHDVFVLAQCASASVSRIVFDWAHTYDFYVAEDWFGMTDLDLQLLVVPSGVVCNFISYSDFDLLFISLLPILMKLFNFYFFRLGNSTSRFLFVVTPFSKCDRRPSMSMVTTSNEMNG